MSELLKTLINGIKTYIDSLVNISEEDVIFMLAKADMIDFATDNNGDIFTDLNNDIIVF